MSVEIVMDKGLFIPVPDGSRSALFLCGNGMLGSGLGIRQHFYGQPTETGFHGFADCLLDCIDGVGQK